MTSPGGQTFTIQAVLPADAALTVFELEDEPSSPPANGEMMTWRYGAEVPGDPAQAVFLHVLSVGEPPTVELLSSTANGASVRVGETVITFDGETIGVGE